MAELIKVTEKDGRQVVSARELYTQLGLANGQFSRWAKSNILDNPFAVENEDWAGFDIDVEGNKVADYALIISFAKKIAMMSKTETGNKIRDYFLECEKKAQNYIPKTYSEALLLAAKQAEQIERQQELIAIQTPKAEFFDAVADSKDAVPMLEVAKVLGIKGMGRNNLFEFLRQQKVLMPNNIPYQKYQDLGYFRVIEQKYTKNYEECINFKTLVYQKGIDFIRKLINQKYKNDGN